MRKRTNTVLLLALILVLAATAGVTLAFMFKKAGADNQFTPAQVTCQVTEKLDNKTYTQGSHTGHAKSDIRVENTGNVPAFLRLRLVSYWVDGDGQVVGLPSQMPELTVDTSRWIPGGDSTYYYAVPVAPGERTAPLCSHVIRLAESKDRADNTIYQVLDAFAEAIQAAPEEAVTQSWQVTLTDGVITAAP